ncbi:MAG: DUF378 domain-containing protein [Candidatus Paceibacterota bacterium]|jgi:hypothetical protein
MKALHGISFTLLVIGGLNWLAVGLAGWDIGEIFGGQANIISRIIYVLVGVSALVILFGHKKDCKMCTAPEMPKM